MSSPNKAGAELGGSRAESKTNVSTLNVPSSPVNAQGGLTPNLRFDLPPGWKWEDEPFLTVGDRSMVCAWATGPGSCRIQTCIPEIARKLQRIPDCNQVGYSVAGRWIRIFAMPYTLQWVAKNVVAKLTLEFLRENEGRSSENLSSEALAGLRHGGKATTGRSGSK